MDDAIAMLTAKLAVARLSIVVPTVSTDPSTEAELLPIIPSMNSFLGLIDMILDRS